MSETRQYQYLRIGAGVAVVATWSLITWLSIRAWPILHQVLWPAKLGCGCGAAVAMSVPMITAITAGLILLGSALLAGRFFYFFIRQIRRSRAIINSWPEAGQRSVYHHSLQDTIVILQRPGRQAMTMGLFRPRVYITADLLPALNGSELLAVLRHEQAHRRRFDPLWSALIDSLSAAWWRMPLWQFLVKANLVLRELAADAVATDDYLQADGLSGAIVKLAEVRPTSEVVAFSPNQDRVQKLLDQTWRPSIMMWRWSYSFALGAAALVVGMIIRLTPPAAAAVPPAVTSACQETRLLCLWQQQEPSPLTFRCSAGSGLCRLQWTTDKPENIIRRGQPPFSGLLPQSLYVLPDQGY